MSFSDDLEAVGFTFTSTGRGGVRHYSLRGNRFLTYYVHVADEATGGTFSFEFALGEYFQTIGLQVGANDVLNLYLYADRDTEVPPSVASVVALVEATETRLNSLRLADPGL